MNALLILTLILGPVLGKAAVEFDSVQSSDGYSIQTCARYPDPSRFPGPRPALMFIQGSGLYDTCLRLERAWATEVVEKGVIIFGRQKRGVQVDPKSLTVKMDSSEYVQNDITSLKRDSLLAFESLQKNPRVNPLRVSIAGGSEGSLLAEAIALAHPNVYEVSLISSMTESFETLYERQISVLMPQEALRAFDKDDSQTLSKSEIDATILTQSGLLSFDNIDINHDGQLNKNELATEFRRALAFSLATGSDTFPMSDFGGKVGVRWLRSMYVAKPIGLEIRQLQMPVTFHHGRSDINVDIESVYGLQKQLGSSPNIKFIYHNKLTHELTLQVISGILSGLADRLIYEY